MPMPLYFQSPTCRSRCYLLARLGMYSSANLHNSLPGVTMFRSAAVTTYIYHLHCRLLAKILRPVRMTSEEICQPVVNLVWNIKLHQLLHWRGVTDCVKGLTKVDRDDHNCKSSQHILKLLFIHVLINMSVILHRYFA